MIKLCIFDLDGTILDTLTSLWHTGTLALADTGFAALPREMYRTMVGDGTATLMERLLVNSGDVECRNYDRILKSYKEHFVEGCMYEVKPYEGILDMLHGLKSIGISLAVFSNKPHEEAQRVVKHVFGENMFDMILGQRNSVPKKPAPDGVYEILDAMHVKKEEALYFGDTNTDMMTGKAAGLFTIGVLWGFREREELEAYHADKIVSNPAEILEYVK